MSGAYVFVDQSQFPDAVQRDLLDSLRNRAINHKLHYDSYKQAAKWLDLHEAHSPARTDPGCVTMYTDAFRSVSTLDLPGEIHVIGLGCGGGQKEARLLQLLGQPNRLTFTGIDASLPLVLTARSAASSWVDEGRCHSVVCDIASAADLGNVLQTRPQGTRIITLFGVIPNFRPSDLLPRVSALLQENDFLLLSANLSPGDDYKKGTASVLPQYDNELTRDWLLTFLLDLGFEQEDGRLAFQIESDPDGLLRIAAYFQLHHARDIRVLEHRFAFSAGEAIRLFFSYRHTTSTLTAALADNGIEVIQNWINPSGEEGVFLCQRAPR